MGGGRPQSSKAQVFRLPSDQGSNPPGPRTWNRQARDWKPSTAPRPEQSPLRPPLCMGSQDGDRGTARRPRALSNQGEQPGSQHCGQIRNRLGRGRPFRCPHGLGLLTRRRPHGQRLALLFYRGSPCLEARLPGPRPESFDRIPPSRGPSRNQASRRRSLLGFIPRSIRIHRSHCRRAFRAPIHPYARSTGLGNRRQRPKKDTGFPSSSRSGARHCGGQANGGNASARSARRA